MVVFDLFVLLKGLVVNKPYAILNSGIYLKQSVPYVDIDERMDNNIQR